MIELFNNLQKIVLFLLDNQNCQLFGLFFMRTGFIATNQKIFNYQAYFAVIIINTYVSMCTYVRTYIIIRIYRLKINIFMTIV